MHKIAQVLGQLYVGDIKNRTLRRLFIVFFFPLSILYDLIVSVGLLGRYTLSEYFKALPELIKLAWNR